MKITRLGSATVLIEVGGIRILCDPWLTDGIYYGAWCNYPPIPLEEAPLHDIDYIYVSHVHPDHFDPETMKLIDPATPVLIHSFHQKFLKANIERLGFTVRELDNATRVELAEGVNFAIYAADNCDPSVCGHLFGCVSGAINGSLQIDSLCVISTEDHVLVNTNDCPYEIAHATLKEVKRDYPEIDYALVGYTTASLYPHCMIEYDAPAKAAGRERARKSGLIRGLRTLQVLKPRYYTPFAGTYIIGGSEYEKNAALPQVEEDGAAPGSLDLR
ncbi:MAG: MBL fold metallo-hydrolase, partial [Pseudomonadota bacterium]